MTGRIAEMARGALRRAPMAAVLLMAVAATSGAALLLTRHIHELRDAGVPAPQALSGAASSAGCGRLRATIAYTSLDAPDGAEAHSRVVWDDAWFAADPTSYNHELAHTSAVLSALAYAESGYYQAGSNQPAYMERALASLGFGEVSTASYRFRSEVADEVLNLFTDDADVVAYTIARKRLHASAAGGEGTPRDLIMVSVRGSYGSEWLSNLNMLPVAASDADAGTMPSVQAAEASADDGVSVAASRDAAGEASAGSKNPAAELPMNASLRERIAASVQRDLAELQADAEEAARPLAVMVEDWLASAAALLGVGADGDGAENADGAEDAAQAIGSQAALALDGMHDHSGYFKASSEICRELNDWIADSRRCGAEVSVLVVGHSRGGAIANLVASELNDQAAGTAPHPAGENAFGEVSSVYAYTFAAPATTVRADARGERYSNIFNIVNPSDIMPYVPLRTWGYERYGVDLLLPAVDDEGFDTHYQVMQRAYKRSVGVESACDPNDARAIAEVVDEVSQRVDSPHALLTPVGVAATVSSCAMRIDPVRVLYGHYPSAYVAWLEAVDADDLTRE